MAESMTPAWLMPIQKTKLVMKKPQKTGRLRPVTPMPRLTMKPAAKTAMTNDQSEEHDDGPVLDGVLEESPEQVPVNRLVA